MAERQCLPKVLWEEVEGEQAWLGPKWLRHECYSSKLVVSTPNMGKSISK